MGKFGSHVLERKASGKGQIFTTNTVLGQLEGALRVVKENHDVFSCEA